MGYKALSTEGVLPHKYQYVKINSINQKVSFNIDIPSGIEGELILSKYQNIKINNIDQEKNIMMLDAGTHLINFTI